MITANSNRAGSSASNPYAMASDLMGGASDIYKGLGEGAGSLGNINDYMNPYYNQVIDAALGRMNTNYQTQLGGIGDQATAAGAFGGDRHGVAEGILGAEYNKNVGDLSANLFSQGFDTAAERAYRDKMASAQGQTALGQGYYNIGNNIADRQVQQGTMQQQLLQQILSGGADMFKEQMQHPYQMIDMMRAIMSSDPRSQQGQASQSSTPGLFDYLSLGAQAYGGS